MGDGIRDERRLLGLATRQLGAVTVRQCLQCGLSYKAQARQVAAGTWLRVFPNVFRIGRGELGQDAREMAALLDAGEGAVLSHLTAARRLGLAVPSSYRIQLSIPGRRRGGAPPGVDVFRVGELASSDRVKRGPFLLTSLPRTLLDSATFLDDGWLRALVESALRQRPSDLARIKAAIDVGSRGRKGAGRLRRLLDGYVEGSECSDSVLESFALELSKRLLVAPVLHHRIDVGEKVLEVDFAWPDRKLCVELDGWQIHGTPRAFASDRTRDRKLARLGWTVLRYTWQEVTGRRDETIAELNAWLAQTTPPSSQ